MSGMTLRGVSGRAVAARSAVNRLRWEVDAALGLWDAHRPTAAERRQVMQAMPEIAEMLGILRNVLDTAERELTPEERRSILTGADAAQSLQEMIARQVEYHRTPR